MTDSHTARHTADIAASAERVWAQVRDFGRVADWHPIAAASRIVSGRNGEVGAERELTLTNGGTVRERLVSLDDATRTLVYRMTTFPIPVTSQQNTIQVAPASPAAHARVTFTANFVPAAGHTADEIRAINEGAFAAAAEGLAKRTASVAESK